jgi:hypothetical protein
LQAVIAPASNRLNPSQFADQVREWRAELLSKGVSVSATAKAYRLLRAVLMTATEDRIIRRNPCHIRGTGDEGPAGSVRC